VREVLKRYPKLRGYRNRPNKAKAQTISIEKLMAKFKAGAIVSPAALVKANLVSRLDGKLPVVKILGNQEIDKALNVRGCQVSQTAKELIMKAGGTIR
jgi:large subunit ribosomal protein L15